MIEQLIEVLIEKFRDQKDRGGHPYIEHIFRVAEEAEALQVGSYITGLIHDALEDTDLTADDLFLLGVRNADINRVSVLTRKPDDVYEHYINRIKKYAKQHNDKIILAVKKWWLTEKMVLSWRNEMWNYLLLQWKSIFCCLNRIRGKCL